MKNKYSLVVSILTIINALFWLFSAGYYSANIVGEMGLDYSGIDNLIVLILIWFIVFYMIVLAVLSSLAYMFNSKTLRILVLVLLSVNGVFAFLIAISSPIYTVIYTMAEILFASLALKTPRLVQNNYGSANNEVRPMRNNFSLVVSILTIFAAVFWLVTAIYCIVASNNAITAELLGFDYYSEDNLYSIITLWFFAFYALVTSIFSLIAYRSNAKTLRTATLILVCMALFFVLITNLSVGIFSIITFVYISMEIVFASLALKPKRVIQNNYGSANNNFVNINEASPQSEQIIDNPIVSNNMGTDFNNNINNEVGDIENMINDDK